MAGLSCASSIRCLEMLSITNDGAADDECKILSGLLPAAMRSSVHVSIFVGNPFENSGVHSTDFHYVIRMNHCPRACSSSHVQQNPKPT